jgi:hypothetical protein
VTRYTIVEKEVPTEFLSMGVRVDFYDLGPFNRFKSKASCMVMHIGGAK